MLRIKVFPPRDFLYAFLATKGLLLVEDKPQILHYTGNNPKELKTLLKEDKPDLLINHSFPTFEWKSIRQVYHPLQTEKDLLQVKKIWTNCYSLCKHYYQRIGLQAEIEIIPSKEVKRAELPKIGIRKILKKLGDTLSRSWEEFKTFMFWE